MKKLFTLFLVVSIYQFASSQTPAFISDSLDSYIQKGMKDWDVPGLAIVIVKDGKVVKMKGYGVRSVNGEPVDENTLFMIASNTKLFTGTSLALLENRNKLSLNDRLTKFFPDYQLYDSISTRLVTIRDLLSHRIGTKTFQGDFTFWNTMYTSEQIMQKMRLLKPVGLFRQDYGYCNSCFLTAGEVIPKVTGIPWNVFVRDSILVPLEMTNSYSVSLGMAERKNVAKPYTTSFTGILKEVPYDQWDNLGPAASIVSNVHDLSHWLMFQLDSGRYNGKQIMPFSVLMKTRDVNIMTSSRRSAILPIHFRGYGLGLFIADYNGKQMYWHTGGAAGMVSNVCFIPEAKLGIAILTNNDNQNFFEALRYQVLDAYLNVPFVNRSLQQLPGFRSDMKEQLQEIAQWKARVKGNKPALPLEEYTGEYVHPLYGSIGITRAGNQLKVKFNSHSNLTATLDYMDKDEWLMQYNNIEYGIFVTRFDLSSNKVKSVSIKANDFVEFDPYVFDKK